MAEKTYDGACLRHDGFMYDECRSHGLNPNLVHVRTRDTCRCTMLDILEDMARVLRVSTKDITLLEESAGGMRYRR